MQMHQGASVNSSKSFHQNIKDFFKKFFIFSKKSCQVFKQLFSSCFYHFLMMVPPSWWMAEAKVITTCETPASMAEKEFSNFGIMPP